MGNVPSRSWPSKRLPDQFGAPTNAQVGRVQDLVRPHPLNDATSAADILADAVFYIDAQEHAADGANAKFVRNKGWGGSVLNARCGSTSVPDTNDPRFLAAEGVSYVYTPGIASNRLSVPDENALDITSDIDIRAQIAADDWTPSALSAIVSKFGGNAAENSWYFALNTNGTLFFVWNYASAVTRDATSTVAPAVSDGAPLWVRVTLDVDNGSSQYDVKFWTSSDGLTWVQLGATITGTTGVTQIFSGTGALEIGTRSAGTTSAFAGKVYRAQVFNGIDGTTVLDVDTSVLTTGSATSFTATTGQTVTINRSTSGRKTVVVPNRDRSGGCWLFGTDDQMQVLGAAGNKSLDWGANDSFTLMVGVRQWPTAVSGSYLMKGVGLTTYWYLRGTSGSYIGNLFFRGSTGASVSVNSPTATTGTQFLFHVVDRKSQTARMFSNGSAGTAANTTAISDCVSPLQLWIGGTSSTAYGDFELFNITVFRRALSAAEIATLTTEFQRRYA